MARAASLDWNWTLNCPISDASLITNFLTPVDGFQTHQILAGWGQNNLFEGNSATVDGSGYGFHFTPSDGNVWTCDNTVQGAAAGKSNIPCSTAP